MYSDSDTYEVMAHLEWHLFVGPLLEQRLLLFSGTSDDSNHLRN